jgi:hypothetical protein
VRGVEVAFVFDVVFVAIVVVLPLLFDQCGSFMPVCFPQRGQMLDAAADVAA